MCVIKYTQHNIYHKSFFKSTVQRHGAAVLVAESPLTLCDPVGCGLPGSSVHGILQAGIPEQVAISFCKGSSQPRDRTHRFCVSCIGKQVLHH